MILATLAGWLPRVLQVCTAVVAIGLGYPLAHVTAQEMPSQESPAQQLPAQAEPSPLPSSVQAEAMQPKFTNGLAGSSSPYLRQHAHNPVNWLPWGPEAFDKAKRENKPIFVSIGYSTCYWCHVMERESFEDEEVAAILNEHYVAVKVDREQRPDIDEQLMLATQLLTGNGGWPNSVWLTVDGRPWMAGTYFPKPRFMEALSKLAVVWRDQPREVDQQANSFVEAIQRVKAMEEASAVATIAATAPIDVALQEAKKIYDAKYGGFGAKPKFPPHGLLRLLAWSAQQRADAESQQMLTETLDAILRGGIHDHVGGGFHRYATDPQWLLPHFEKMLYDNAQLLRSLAEAYALTNEPRYRVAADGILAWLEREMTDPLGGFYSALDSETEGEEGGYYTWRTEELQQVLGDAAVDFAIAYGVQADGNFREEASGEKNGTNILHLPTGVPVADRVPDADRVPVAEGATAWTGVIVEPVWAQRRGLLLAARQRRAPPHLDDKILAGWNGLMISGLAYAGVAFADPRYTQAAERAAIFVSQRLIDDRGQLWRCYRAGQVEVRGYLEDYAYMADGLIELQRATGDDRWLVMARELANHMLEKFNDAEAGGFFFASDDHEALLVRTKNLNGGGNLPVANGIAACVLLRLAELSPEPEYGLALERTLQGLSGIMQRAPRQVEHLVLVDAMVRQAKLAGDRDTAEVAEDRHASPAVVAELFVSHQQVAVGQELKGVVRLGIQQGFHLLSATDNPNLKIVQFKVISPTFEPLDLQSPVAREQSDALGTGMLSVYEGEVQFSLSGTLKSVPAGATEVDLVVQLEYQACDESRCLEPVAIELVTTLSVTEQPGPRRHPAVIVW